MVHRYGMLACVLGIRVWVRVRVRVILAGLQGEQPLVDRTMYVREVGKIDP